MQDYKINRVKNQGVTLIELMIVVAIIGVLAAVAVPSYNHYVEVACYSSANKNMDTLQIHLQNYRLEFDTYLAGTHTAGGTSDLAGPLKWNPDDDETYTYVVSAGPSGIADSYTIKATGVTKCLNVQNLEVTYTAP